MALVTTLQQTRQKKQTQQKQEREKLKVGSKIEVYSDSQQKWFKGSIIKIFTDKEGEWLTVKYQGFRTKEVQRFSDFIRLIPKKKKQKNENIFPDPLVTLRKKKKKKKKQDNLLRSIKYRKHICDLIAPSGELAACGYIRNFDKNIEIPNPISIACTQFLGLYLNNESSLIITEKDDDETKNNEMMMYRMKKCSLQISNIKKWESLSILDKRLLRDQLIFDIKLDLFQIQCEIKSKNFGLNGVSWIGPILKNARSLAHINLSNCYLNDKLVECVANSIKLNKYTSPLKWIDISDNTDVTDKSIESIISIIDKLNGFNLNCTGITDKGCILLSNYFKSNVDIFEKLVVVKLNENKGITQIGKNALKEFQSKLILVMDA